SIVLDPHHPERIYFVGEARALAFFSSLDAGQTWTVRPFVGMGPDKVDVDFAGKVLYVSALPSTGGGNDLLYKSTDGGATWMQRPIPLTPGTNSTPYPHGAAVAFFAADKTVAGTVYVIDSLAELFKSTDYGETWTFISKVPQTDARAIEQDPRHSKTWYMGTDYSSKPGSCPSPNGGLCGMFKSTDGALTFTALDIPTTFAKSVGIGFPDGTLYAAGQVTGLGAVVLKTTDGGGSWTPIATGLFTPTDGRLWADPTSPLLFTNSADSNHDFDVSDDGGANFAHSVIPQGPAGCKPGGCEQQLVYDVAIVPTLGPVITAVVNGASLLPGIAANTWVTIFGTNLASTTGDWSNSVVNGVLPTSIDHVKVTISGKPAYVYFVSPGQLNVLAPGISSGSVDVTVTTEVGTSAAFSTTAADFAPAFFTWPSNQVVATRQDFSFAVKQGTFPGTSTIPAKPGDVIILWATGFGATNPAYPLGKEVPFDKTYAAATNPAIKIDGRSAVVFGAALAPGSSGLYQIAIQVPNDLASGDYAIQATVGGTSSPTGLVLSVSKP
ncbi:MAG TPA: IPT/TIG domain-containing protein, partial [Bryobacteraceae bacterium]|nr:IPT/TIG domain-containing protein [Bryobacteraceae bacterium]